MTTTAPRSYKRAKNPDTPEVTSKYYLTNSRLLPEVLVSIEKGKISNELAKMLMMLTRKYAQKYCFANYTFKEDMISEALANLCQNALKFNPEKSKNPFAFYTTCIHNTFLQFLNIEKRHRKIRDQLLIDMGENPSYNFSEEYKNQVGEDFSSEMVDLRSQIEEAKKRLTQEEIDKLAAAAKAEADAVALALALNQDSDSSDGFESDDLEIESLSDDLEEDVEVGSSASRLLDFDN